MSNWEFDVIFHDLKAIFKLISYDFCNRSTYWHSKPQVINKLEALNFDTEKTLL